MKYAWSILTISRVTIRDIGTKVLLIRKPLKKFKKKFVESCWLGLAYGSVCEYK